MQTNFFQAICVPKSLFLLVLVVPFFFVLDSENYCIFIIGFTYHWNGMEINTHNLYLTGWRLLTTPVFSPHFDMPFNIIASSGSWGAKLITAATFLHFRLRSSLSFLLFQPMWDIGLAKVGNLPSLLFHLCRYGRMIACFRYASTDVHSVYLPPSKLDFNYENQEWIQKEKDEVE